MKKRIMKDQNGFTLVELIVVLVILAILAAILVPALLGYIDKARNGQYLEEAHSIYTAIQVVEDEAYAKGAAAINNGAALTADQLKEVNAMVEPTKVTSAKVKCKDNTAASTDKKAYSVNELELEFTSQDTKTVTIKMGADGSWGTPSVS